MDPAALGAASPARSHLGRASGTCLNSHFHSSLRRASVPGAVLGAFCTFVSARSSQTAEVPYSSTRVTKPEYFRSNYFRDLGATIKTSQLRVFFVLSCIWAEVGRGKPTEKLNFINFISKIHLMREMVRHFNATLLM